MAVTTVVPTGRSAHRRFQAQSFGLAQVVRHRCQGRRRRERPARGGGQGPAGRTFDGGLHTLDGESPKLALTTELPGFNRVNPAGDEDHIIVSTDNGFRILDATGQALTDIEYQGAKPGHVVRHAGKRVSLSNWPTAHS